VPKLLTYFLTQVYAAGSEDMDTLTFSAPILYRHLTFSEAKKAPIKEINLEKVLEGLEMDMSQVSSLSSHPCNALMIGLAPSSLLNYASYLGATTWSLLKA
jgi:hypothetical protein